MSRGVNKKIIVCKDCGEERPHCAKGLCRLCWHREWNKKNSISVKESRHKYYRDDPKRSQEQSRSWRYGHRENYRRLDRKQKQLRRARVSNLPAPLTEQDWQEILDCWDYQCAYCGEHDFNLQQEHVTPVSQGGGYTIENIVPACRSCNAKKGGRTPIEAGMSFITNTL